MIEWHGLTSSRVMPSVWRRPMLSPFATTTRRAEISSPVDSVTRLPFRAGRDVVTLAWMNSALGGNLAADGVDQRVVEDAVLVARPLLDQAAEARDPGFAVERGGAQHRIGEPGLAQDAACVPSSFSQRKSGG